MGNTDTISEILRLKELPPDWDSHGAGPIVISALDDAREFIFTAQLILSGAYVAPIVGPSPDRGVGLVWSDRRLGEVEVRCSPRGNRYVIIRDGKVIERGPINIHDRAAVRRFIEQYIAS